MPNVSATGHSMKQIRVNITTRVNNAKIRKEQRNGRDVIVVPSATLPFGVVMNGGMYPEEEIRNSFHTLDRTPAPFGHPMVNGQFVSARDPEAINGFWVGAWNENVRIEGNRVKLDKVIDVKRAEENENGRALLEAINKNEPIDTSTGLLLEREPVQNNDAFDWIARNMHFDHDAILVNDRGAATPSQGVGMMVNGEEVDVINSRLEMLEDEIEHSARIMFELIEAREDEKQKQSRWNEVKSQVVSFVKSLVQSPDEDEQAAGLSANRNEGVEMPITEEQFKALADKVDTLVANAESKPVAEQITEAVTAAVKPIQDQLAANAEAEKAAEKAKHEKAVEAVVNAEILEKEVAETMATNALEALAEKYGKPGAAYGVNGTMKTGDSDKLSMELPGGDK